MHSSSTDTDSEARTPKAFAKSGTATFAGVFAHTEIDAMAAAIDAARSNEAVRRRRDDVYAMRNVHRSVPELMDGSLLDRLRPIATGLLGAPAFLTRSLLFDKPPGANWSIRWHQDVTIAVRERRDAPGFGPWSVKAGIPHVRAAASVLERMVALRVHLDDSDEHNGALLVVPGAHLEGRIEPTRLAELRSSNGSQALACRRGDVIAMRPLLPHASRPATTPSHRRVIHLEFACDDLPCGLEWYDRA